MHTDDTHSQGRYAGPPLEHRQLLRSFKLTPEQKREVWAAYQQAPDALIRCAQRAKREGHRGGIRGTGLLMRMIRDCDHLDDFDPTVAQITGWRWVRGSHGGNFIRDPQGTDRLPDWYDVRPLHVIDASRIDSFDDAM